VAEAVNSWLGVVVALGLLIDLLLIVAAYVYTRFLFSAYLRKYHRDKWDALVYSAAYRGLSLFAFDKSPAMRTFRYESTADLGDPEIPRMRRKSIWLLNTAIIAWLTLVGMVLLGGLVAALLLR